MEQVAREPEEALVPFRAVRRVALVRPLRARPQQEPPQQLRAPALALLPGFRSHQASRVSLRKARETAS